MKRRTILIFTVCCILSVAALFAGGSSLNMIMLPFSLTAQLLRTLSLSGSAGNIASIILFILVGLFPLLFKIRRKWYTEDILLFLASISSWYALYNLINPALRPATLGGEVGEFILAGTVYSILICWGVVRLMKHCKNADQSVIYNALEIFLLICAAERTFAIVSRFAGLLSTAGVVAETNTMPGVNLVPTYLFLVAGFAVAVLEYGLNAFVLYLGAKLVRKLKTDPYSEECTGEAKGVSNWCARALVIITASHMLLNLAQVFLARFIHRLVAQFQLPVLSLAVVFALMALSGLLSRGKAIKDDNDLFI